MAAAGVRFRVERHELAHAGADAVSARAAIARPLELGVPAGPVDPRQALGWHRPFVDWPAFRFRVGAGAERWRQDGSRSEQA